MKASNNPHITSIEELHIEMRKVKHRIKEREVLLEQRWNQLPGESVKAAAGAILPVFLGNELASGVGKLLKGVVELVKGKKGTGEEGSGTGWKDLLASGTRQLGFFGALKLFFNLWKGK